MVLGCVSYAVVRWVAEPKWAQHRIQLCARAMLGLGVSVWHGVVGAVVIYYQRSRAFSAMI